MQLGKQDRDRLESAIFFNIVCKQTTTFWPNRDVTANINNILPSNAPLATIKVVM